MKNALHFASNGPIYNYYKPSIATPLPKSVAFTTSSAALAVSGGYGAFVQATEDCGIKQGTADTVEITAADLIEDGVIWLLGGQVYLLELDPTTTHIAHRAPVGGGGVLNIVYTQQLES